MTTEPERIPTDLAAKALGLGQRRTSAPPAAPPAERVSPLGDEVAALQRQVRTDRWLSIVPPVYRDPTLAKLREGGVPAQVVDDLTGWGDDPSRNLVLLGPVGTGKTYAAWAALRRAYGHGHEVLGVGAVDMLDALRPSGDGDHLTSLYRAVQLLFIDDLGAERPTDWTAERIYALIHHRWEHERPTVLTANLDPEGLREALGPRSYSRMVDGALVLRLAGEDRRRARRA